MQSEILEFQVKNGRESEERALSSVGKMLIGKKISKNFIGHFSLDILKTATKLREET